MEIPKVFVINLDSRPDRWLHIQKLCRTVGIYPERIPAIKMTPGWHGCGYSHIKCAQLAKERKLPWVLVLEDDCVFSQDDFSRFKSALPWLWNNKDKWEMFNGAMSYPVDISELAPEISIYKGKGQTANFILYHANVYDKVIKWKPSDDACDLYFKHKLNMIFLYPTVARQLAEYSDIEQKVVDYNNIFDDSNAIIRKFIEKFEDSGKSSIPPLSVYVINLDHRTDRWESIKKMCSSCGIIPNRISAIKAKPGSDGCAMSHIKVAIMASEKNEPWYLVLEDDALFTVEQWAAFLKLLPFLWEHRTEWDIFTGGPNNGASTSTVLYKEPLLYSIKSYGSHFWLINNKAYNTIKSWKKGNPPIDNYAIDNCKIISTYPFIAYQSGSKSDITPDNNAEGSYDDIKKTEEEVYKIIKPALTEGFTVGKSIYTVTNSFTYTFFNFFRSIL